MNLTQDDIDALNYLRKEVEAKDMQRVFGTCKDHMSKTDTFCLMCEGMIVLDSILRQAQEEIDNVKDV